MSYETAEKEKREFVGDGFIKCYADFQDFKEGETYWLEYIGDDKYNVRSDNLLGKTYHITPCQLYTIFKKQTWLEKQGEQKSLDDVVKEITKNKETAMSFLKSCGIMNANGELADEYKIEQGEQKSAENIEPEKPNYCHHEVDLSECSEEYRKAYYDGWNNCNQQHAQLKAEQKPAAWSEEDELHIRELESLVKQEWAIAECENDKDKIHKMSDLSFFLKTLKPQLKQEWSEEDEKFFKTALWHISYSISKGKSTDFHCDTTEWFKSLKNRYALKPSVSITKKDGE
jgi:hypothetical protein